MLVSSIVGFKFGNTKASSSQNVQQSQKQQSAPNNNLASCCPKGHKNTQPHSQEKHNKLSLFA